MRQQILAALIVGTSLVGCLEPPDTKQEGEACSAEETCRQGLSCVDGTCTDLGDTSDMGADAAVPDDTGNPIVDMGTPEDTGGTPEDMGGEPDLGGGGDDAGPEDMGQVDMAEPACGGACPDLTPFCDVASDECAVCIDDENCQDGEVCLAGDTPAGNACVQCAGNTDCATGVCDTDTNTCVACLGDDDCTGGVCEMGATTMDNTCVECLGDGDCPGGVCEMGPTSMENECVQCLGDDDCPGGVCDLTSNSCVTCLVDSDCPNTVASACNAQNQCIGCTVSSECGHLTGTPQCDPGQNRCVECFDDDETTRAACNGNSCDPSTNMCTGIPTKSVETCGTCTADSECKDGFACVPMDYQGQFFGNFCLQRMTSSCPSPYVFGTTRQSLSGDAPESFCGLRENLVTCDAVTRFGTPCMSDADCMSGGLCRTIDASGSDKCTFGCVTDDDCKTNTTCGSDGYCQ